MPVPFDGEQFEFENPDGTKVEVRGWGDQFHAVFETLDGFTVVKDPDSGFYQYARLSDDKNELAPTGVNVGQGEPRGLGLRPHLRVRREAAKERARTAAAEGPRRRRWEVRRDEKKGLARSPLRALGPAAPPAAGAIVGAYVGLCVLIEFPDVPQTIGQQEVDDFCNGAGYTGFGNNGSVRDYFHDVSGARLTYTNVVTPYYTASQNRLYYTDPQVPYGTRARELIVEALDHLVAGGFDLSALSSDGAGYIYALNVFYAQSRVNNWAEGLWPHSSGLASPYTLADGRRFNDYQITDMGTELTLGTFCHENGHMICDFPDLYDYGYESRGVGDYSLMAFGGYEKNPVHVDAYLKNEVGWTARLGTLAPGTSAAIEAGVNAFYIHAKSPTEYFIVENRQQSGRDASLPDSGLAIWHVDELGSNSQEQMTPAQHYECSLEQADGRFDLEHGFNVGDSEDLFGAPYATGFADNTAPASQWWDGSASGLSITAISAPGPIMTFDTGVHLVGTASPLFVKHSGRALTVGASGLEQRAYTGAPDLAGGTDQIFRAEQVDGVHYRLVSLRDGKVLDVERASTASGARVILWEYHGGDNQLFRIEPLGDGYNRIVAKHSAKVLDVKGGVMADGAPVIQWHYTGGDNQRWSWLAVPILAIHSGQALDVAGGSTGSGTPLIQWPPSGRGNQLFRREPMDADHFALIALHSGKALDIERSSTANGARVITWDLHGGDNQRFRFEPTDPSSYRIVAKHSGKVLDVQGGAFQPGTPIIQWEDNGGAHQRFRRQSPGPW